MTELFELVRYRYYIKLSSEANVLKMLEWLIVVMKAEDDGSEQLVSLARTSLVFILQSNLPVMAVLGLARRKTQSPLPSAPMDRGIHSSPSPLLHAS